MSQPNLASPQQRSLRIDVLQMLVTRGGLLVCATASTTLLSRALGPGGRGPVAVALALSLLLVQFGTAGVVTANPYMAVRRPEVRGALVANSVWLATILGAALFGIGLAVDALVPSLTRGVDSAALLVALGGIPFALGAQYLQSLLLGERRLNAYNGIDIATTALGVALLALATVVADLDVVSALAILVGVRVVAAAAFLIVLRRHNSVPLRPDLSLARRMAGYGARVYLATLLAFLVIRLDLLLVNAYLGSSASGLYAAAVSLADGLYVFPSVVALNLFTRVAHGTTAEQTARVFRLTALTYGLVCLVALALAGPTVSVLFGGAFAQSATLLRALIPGIYCMGLLNIIAQHLAGRGFPLKAALVWFVGLALNLALNLVLLPGGPLIVAPLASTAAYAVLLVLHVRLFAGELGSWRPLVPRPGELVTALADLRRSLAPGRAA